MDHLWGGRGDGGELSGEGRSDGDEKDMEEEEEASEDEEEDDDDLELQAGRPLKRGKHSLARLSVAMGAAGVDGGQGQDAGSSAAIPSDDEEDGDDEGEEEEEEEDDDDDDDQEEEEKEVIEILDDDEMEDHEEDPTAVSSHGRSNPSVSPAGAASKLEPIPLPSIFLPANLLSRQSPSPRPATASSRDPTSPSSRSNPRDRPRTWTSITDLEHMLGVRSPSPPLAPHYALEDRPTRSPGSSPHLDPSAANPDTAERCGKMSPEELAAGDAGPGGIRSPVMPAQSEELEQALGMPATSENNGGAIPAWTETSSEIASTGSPSSVAAGATGCASSGDGIGSSSPSEFPMELECAICFLPIAVMALFACGHGCCWECAHNWCSRGTSATMDCPTCHVSVPRNDFRRCVILDEVVERAVRAAGVEDEEFENRLNRGKRLAQEAEAKRRSQRDAQRALEDTISQQTAELERLREEARARPAPQRRRMFEHQDHSNRGSADYGLRMMTSREPWAASQSQMEEIFVTRSFRHRRPDLDGPGGTGGQRIAGGAAVNPVAPGLGSGEGSSSVAAAAAAAAALGMPHGSQVASARANGMVQHPPGSLFPPATSVPAGMGGSSGGLARGEPWFSLRPYSNNREAGASGASGGRASAGSHKELSPSANFPARGSRRTMPACSLVSSPPVRQPDRQGNGVAYPNRRDAVRGSGDPGTSRPAMVYGGRFVQGMPPESSAQMRARGTSSSLSSVYNGLASPAVGMGPSQPRGSPGVASGRRLPSAGQEMSPPSPAAAGAVPATMGAMPGPGRFGGKRLNLQVPSGAARSRPDQAVARAGCAPAHLGAASTVPRGPQPVGAVAATGVAGATVAYGQADSMAVGLLNPRGPGHREASRGDLRDGRGDVRGGGVAAGVDGGPDSALGISSDVAGGGLDGVTSDLEPLDVVSQHEDLESRSEWDDVLAAVSLPLQPYGAEGLRRSASPGSHHG